ncbi:hypothetical protein CC86DRAFT_389765 [Ophiobolus disseminans]|uniref:protein disulfide-isomerase n=1 Tax=Ophiobolus disseminans TaxID=1469910 RepID=A0A6A7ALN5_9PLEO|nr:hypothetical protein CC86DRAFT_389765 [Ophiobolus disseminans]
MHMTRYRGPRTEKAIRDFVKRRELPIVTHIETAQLETLKEINDIVVVAYLPPDSPTLLSIFTSIASQHHFDFVFGYTTSASDASKENLPVPSIKIFKNADDDHRILNGAFTASSLSNFLTTAVPKVIRDFREKDLETFMQRDKLTLYIFTSSEDQACALRTGLTPLAKKYEKYVVFAVADGEKHKEMASNFLARFDAGGVGGGLKMPGVVVHAPLNDNVFMYARGKEIEQEVVESMLVTILQGKARSGDVFGREASDVEEGGREEWGHDEL